MLVYEAADGQIEIRYRDRLMRWQEIATNSVLAKQKKSPSAWQPSPRSPAAAPVRVRASRPSVDHPWRRGYDERAAKRAAYVAAP